MTECKTCRHFVTMAQAGSPTVNNKPLGSKPLPEGEVVLRGPR